MITIFKNLNETTSPYYISVDSAIDRIRNGKSKDLCEQIRKPDLDKSQRNEIKKKLPAVCYGGKFSSRSIAGLIESSGFMSIDFDGFSSPTSLETKRFELEMDDYTHSLFTSPSGDGLKVLVRIPMCDANEYKQYFKAIEQYYDCEEFDTACSDISRITYESYDPHIFTNENSKLWTEKFIEPEREHRKVLIPTNDTNKITIGILSWWNKNYGLVSGARNHNMYVLAQALNEYGVDRNEALHTCLQFVQPDFTESEISRTVESAYVKTEIHGTKQWEDKATVQKVTALVANGVTPEEIRKIVPEATDDVLEDIKVSEVEFWTKDPKTGAVNFINHKYREFLTENGFFKYYASKEGTFIFVHLRNNVIREVLDDHIKDFVSEWMFELEDKSIYNSYVGNLKLQKEDFLSFLPSVNHRFLMDSEKESYIFYRNCAVKVTPKGTDRMSYDDLNGLVWEKSILDRDYREIDHVGCDFERFIYTIAGSEADRFLTMRTTLGYMLHRYNDPAYNPVVILNDESITDKPEGGTGKGIFVNSVSKIRRSVILDAQKIDLKGRFTYQRVSTDTQVICFNDADKGFHFQTLFSMITDGMSIEVKNSKEIFIPFDLVPKMIITTNWAIKGGGNSHDRRRWEVEFHQFYNKSHTPKDELGRRLFDDWDADEWSRFDSFMISNMQLYMQKGLREAKFKNLDNRQLFAKTSPEFYEWATGSDKSYSLKPGIEFRGADLMADFISQYPDYGAFGKMKLAHRTFYNWIKEFALIKYGELPREKKLDIGKSIVFIEPMKQLKINEFDK